MTNQEACNVLMSLSNLVNVSEGWEDSAKSAVNEAVLKAIAAITEQDKLANDVWRLYKKYQSRLATNVIEFGDELKELLRLEEG